MSDHQEGIFPLFEKARKSGILESGNGLIVAPTATGKSYIGRTILIHAVKNKEPGVHVYLVPYRALASEMYDSFGREVRANGVDAVIRVATGDNADPIYPQQTNILVATYERFAGILRLPDFRVGRVIIDEVHLIADQTRGPVVEGLVARMKSHKRPSGLCALSAVVSNPDELGNWLGVPVILGEKSDRMVEVEFCCEIAEDVDEQLKLELISVLERDEQAVIFCRSKAVSQGVVRDLKPIAAEFLTIENKEALRQVALEMAEDDEDAQDLLELLSGGIAFHHAGLSRDSRKAVETAFREKHLKAIACTPTLAAGVNLPARLVVEVPMNRARVRGHIDLLLKAETGEPEDVEFVDFKTAANRPLSQQHQNQLRLYAEAARALGMNPVRLAIHDLDADRGGRMPVEDSERAREEFRAELQGWLEQIAVGDFLPKWDAKTCPACDFMRLCNRRAGMRSI